MSQAALSIAGSQSPFDSLMEITSRPPVVFVEGHGSWLRDADGKQYLDFVQGWAVNCLGHWPRCDHRGARRAGRQLINCSPAFYNEPMVRLAGLIARQSGLDQTFLANQRRRSERGRHQARAQMGHRKIAAAPTRSSRWITASMAGRSPRWRPPASRNGSSCSSRRCRASRKVPLNDLAAVEHAITRKTVAVMLEPIQGEAGVFEATDEFLRGLRALTRKHGLLLILDEVQTGIGRTGRFFGFEHAGVAPDIMTLARGSAAASRSARWWRARTCAASSTATRAERSTAIR